MIQSVELKHTNPSLGPYERIITYSLSNTDVHKVEFDQLLNKSTINGFDLKIFLTAYQEKDEATIAKVFKADYQGDLNCGQTISILKISLKGGLEARISDLRTTQMSGYYSDFIRYLVKNGSRYEDSINEEPFLKHEEPLFNYEEPIIKNKEPILKNINKDIRGIEDTDISI